MLKCFIFRINRVIADISLLHFLSWKSVFCEINVNITGEQWKVVDNLPRLEAGKTLFKLNKIPYNENLLIKLTSKKNDIYKHLLENAMGPSVLYPGVVNLLNDIKKQKFMLVCASASQNASLQLKRTKLFNKFDYILDWSSKEFLAISKREIIESINPVGLILDKFKLSGQECIGIGQNINEIEQYKKMNVFAVMVHNFDPVQQKAADFALTSFDTSSLEEIIFNYYKKHSDDSNT